MAEIEYVEGLFGTYEKRFIGELRQPRGAVDTSVVNRTFGDLRVIEHLGITGKNSASVVGSVCVCGKFVASRVVNIKHGGTISCGCYAKSYLAIRNRTAGMRAPETRRRQADAMRNKVAVGESSKLLAMSQAKSGAKRRGLSWELTVHQFEKLSKGRCYLCGAMPGRTVQGRGANGSFTCSGIDRVNNDKGYVFSNCRPCCVFCNRIKMDHSLSDTLAHIQKIAAYQSCADIFT